MKSLRRRIFLALSTLLALATLGLAVRSFWISDEAAWCTWEPSPPPAGTDRRLVVGSSDGGFFLLRTVAKLPADTNFDWFGGEEREMVIGSNQDPRVAWSAIGVTGTHNCDVCPKWLYGGFNVRSKSPWSGEFIVVPYWAPMLLFAWPSLLALRRQRLRYSRRKRGLCPECAYDLRASGDVCSECGTPRTVEKPGAVRRWCELWRLLWRWRWRVLACMAVVVLGIFSWWWMNQPVRVGRETVLSPQHAPSRIELPLGEGVTMRFVLIPAGHFTMGSPGAERAAVAKDLFPLLRREQWGEAMKWLGAECPQHEVTISRPFYMGQTPVTQEQYDAVMGANPSDRSMAWTVSWADCAEFCGKLDALTGRKVRLPTEAEWEYAYRAGTTTPFNTGRTLRPNMATYHASYSYPASRWSCYVEWLPSENFPPNAWGLCMHNLCSEWCSDWYGSYPTGAVTDPKGPTSGLERVLRGGTCGNAPCTCRAAYRNHYPPGGRYRFTALRLCLDLQ